MEKQFCRNWVWSWFECYIIIVCVLLFLWVFDVCLTKAIGESGHFLLFIMCAILKLALQVKMDGI